MIELKELVNRQYDESKCISFDYYLNDSDDHKIPCRFIKVNDGYDNHWNIQVVLERTRDADSQVYTFGYIIPKEHISLKMIAAIGLKYFQNYLKEEVQAKSNLDFMIGNITEGMAG